MTKFMHSNLWLFLQENFSDIPFTPVSHMACTGWSVWSRAGNEIGSALEAGVLRIQAMDESNSVRKSNVKINVMQTNEILECFVLEIQLHIL